MTETDERDQLPPGWWMSERGPVSPKGVVYSTILPGYELADLEYMEQFLEAVLGIEEAA
jgi:hypothetical protein